MESNDRAALLRRQINQALESWLPAPAEDDPAGMVRRAMRYSVFGRGKRIRPILTLSFCELCGGDPADAMPFACAVELVHTYSLIHDDLPCMDDDDLRRGRPTNHKIFGEAMALLAGDALLTKAFEIALSAEDHALAAQAALILAQGAGDKGMVGGQCMDLKLSEDQVTADLLRQMDQGKTVALIDAACRMGCVAAGAGEAQLAAASRYAQGLGMAFQIRDDVLDVLGDAASLGKNVGVDAARDKQNYVSFLGVLEAQRLVEEYSVQAAEALADFPGDPAFLREFATSLAIRVS